MAALEMPAEQMKKGAWHLLSALYLINIEK